MSGSCVDENALLMSEVRGEWADWLEMIESHDKDLTVQACCCWWCNGVGIFLGTLWAPLVPIEHRLNATVSLSIVADHVHPFMTTVYPSSDDYFQQDNVTKLKSSQTGFLNMKMCSLYSNDLHSHQISIQ